MTRTHCVCMSSVVSRINMSSSSTRSRLVLKHTDQSLQQEGQHGVAQACRPCRCNWAVNLDLGEDAHLEPPYGTRCRRSACGQLSGNLGPLHATHRCISAAFALHLHVLNMRDKKHTLHGGRCLP